MKSIIFGFPPCAFTTAAGGFECIEVALEGVAAVLYTAVLEYTIALFTVYNYMKKMIRCVRKVAAKNDLLGTAVYKLKNNTDTGRPSRQTVFPNSEQEKSTYRLGLRKHPRSIRKCVSYRGSELP